jgi:hypothetical protein
MGCSTSLVEHKEFYDSGELRQRHYSIAGIVYGVTKIYQKNGDVILLNYYHNNIIYRTTGFYNGGIIWIDSYYYYHNNDVIEYRKKFDRNGSVREDIVYAISNEIPGYRRYSMSAEYVNTKLIRYSIRYAKLNDGKRTYLISRGKRNSNIIDLSIINPIRSFQRIFRRRLYFPILNILDHVINVHDISLLVLSYFT